MAVEDCCLIDLLGHEGGVVLPHSRPVDVLDHRVVAEHGVTVALSSHLVADLERVCDFLVVLVTSHVQLAGEVGTLLASHHRLSGLRRDPRSLPACQHVIEESHTDKQSTLLVRTNGPILDPAWTVKPVTLEDLVLAYMGQARHTERVPRQGLSVIR